MNDAGTPLSSLSSLADETRANLSKRWKQTLGRDMPANLRLELAVPILAYRIQEKQFRKLRRQKSIDSLEHSSTFHTKAAPTAPPFEFSRIEPR